MPTARDHGGAESARTADPADAKNAVKLAETSGGANQGKEAVEGGITEGISAPAAGIRCVFATVVFLPFLVLCYTVS